SDLVPVPELGRKITVVLTDKVEALALEAIQCGNLPVCDETAPQVAEFLLRTIDAKLDLFDMGARFFECHNRLVDHRDDALVDWEDAVVARVADALALDQA